MNISTDRLGGLILLAFSLAYGLIAKGIPASIATAELAMTARTMPMALSALAIVCSLWLICVPTEHPSPLPRPRHWSQFFAIVILMSAYGLTLRPLGFVIATSVFLALGFFILGERRWRRLLLYAIVISIAFWAVLNLGLGVYIEAWPSGLRQA